MHVWRAGVAHLVERDLAKVEVAGSKPVSRSTQTPILYSNPAHRDARKRTKTLCRLTFAPLNPGDRHSMGKLHGAEMAHVNGDELFDPMSLREPQ